MKTINHTAAINESTSVFCAKRLRQLLPLAWILSSTVATATVYQVGPSRAYPTLQSVVASLKAGDEVLVDGNNVYPGNVTFSKNGTVASNIVVTGVRVNGKRPVLSGTNLASGTRAVVSLLGSNYVFQGFEIHGALNANISKAGLYHNAQQCEVRDTLVRDCYYNGILGADASGSLTLDKVEVFNCGNGLLYHQVYVASDNLNHSNAVFRMQFCYLHDGRGGNNVKSRVGRSEIYYNWIEKSYYLELDLIGADPAAQAPNTADLVREDADVVGNVFYKHPASKGVVARVGSDGTGSSNGRYRFVNNTVVLGSNWTAFVLRAAGPRQSMEWHNNVVCRAGGGGIKLVESTDPALGSGDGFYGFNNWLPANSSDVPGGLANTLHGAAPYLADVAGFDFAPTNASPLLDAGLLPTTSPAAHPFPSPLPAPLYLPPPHAAPDPTNETVRLDSALIDIGAYESIPLPPIILQQPANLVRTAGQSAQFTVVAGGSLTSANPLQYQWYFNNLAIANATNSSRAWPVTETNHTGNYQVIVTNTFGAVTSSIAALTVNPDTNKPSVTISYPAANANVFTNQLLLKGGAQDDIAVAEVRVKLNDADFVPAFVSNQPAGKATWSLPATLPPGTNLLWVYTADAVGNCSATNSRKFFHAVPLPLIVSRIGEGKVTPDYNSSNLFVGRNYFMVAAPLNTNWLFTNWLSVIDGVTNVATGQPRLVFGMQSNLTLIAEFVTNRFIAAAGSYNGLFWDTNNGVAFESAGFFSIKVTSKPFFSGTLCLAGEKLACAGAFDLTGTGVSTTPIVFRTRTNTLTVQVRLPFDDSDTISGTVSNKDGSWVSDLSGVRAVFSAANPALDFLGRYTLVIPHGSAGPEGDGYGVVNLGSNGVITVAGQLGDGVAWSQSVPVGKFGDWPLFARAYPVTNGTVRVKAGLLMGWLGVSNGLVGAAHWLKTAVPTDAFYPDGFTNAASIAGSIYTNSALATNAILVLTNGTLVFTGGNLGGPLTNSVKLSAQNKFTGSTNYGLVLSVAKPTGKLTGTFKPPGGGGPSSAFAGVVLQDTNTGHGVFRGTNQTGNFQLQSN